ncbi:MAG: ATPase [Bacteroidetes bacterium]|nr:ATPase [Bacteroidota bacterium]
MNKDMFITKASGEKSLFSEKKLSSSLQRAGATEDQINSIIAEISSQLFEGMTTKNIYRLAFKRLRENSRPLAARYNLKQAIMELGPSGFPFEKYVSKILNHQGYKTKIGEIVKGKCVSHEIDVIAEKENNFFMIECKYHNLPGIFCDVKIPLYIESRFRDVEAEWMKLPGHDLKTHQGWVVTNTRFSTDALQYGICAGLNLLGWDYPINAGLRDQIDSLGLYPITCLTSLTKVEKQRLLDKGIILCKEIYNEEKILVASGVKPSRILTVMKEAQQLCKDLILKK